MTLRPSSDRGRMARAAVCHHCGRTFGDPRGCRYSGCTNPPVAVAESACADCESPPGAMHHITCPAATCSLCGGRYGRCFGVDCGVALA